ncbi:MAG: hypothetical protein ABJF11_13530 [Reichenbachiella sp.]|uniref:hypothetical protein n=1 Tax=Reichenbachiella sp. TaxID=2184521 RepID=UPI0032679599
MERYILIGLWAFCALFSCSEDSIIEDMEEPDDTEEPKDGDTECEEVLYFTEEVSNVGIPLFTGSQARNGWTEMNTQYSTSKNGSSVSTDVELKRFDQNSYLRFSFENLFEEDDVALLRVSAFRKIFDGISLPDELKAGLEGVSFRAGGICSPVTISVEAWDTHKEVIASEQLVLKQDTMSVYQFKFEPQDFKWIEFKVQKADQSESSTTFEGILALDDIYLMDGTDQPYYPSENEAELLSWLRKASMRHFLWYYTEISGGQGYVPETSTNFDKISLSGIGYGYAIFIMAEQDGIISANEAKSKTLAMLKWQQAQNWFDGSGGWHGFPHHYFKPDGTYDWPDVSTIDWVMCAAGIRVARQRYLDDPEIKSIAEELLSRPEWGEALAEDDKIVMGFDGITGDKNDYRWALGFSEETELIYLEAVASGKLNNSIFEAIVREKKNGFYPSWFGAGFTYNWLQLWTGKLEPYATNSQMAYQSDASTCSRVFGKPLMGLTACATLSDIEANGFVNWNNYISNQGADIHGASGTTSILRISPAPYGAALGLPFAYNEAITALKEYVRLGFYHEFIGLPDNVRLKNLPGNIDPVANWDQYDINIGPIAMAIEQIQSNNISKYYLSDPEISTALDQLSNSFNF